MTTFTNRHSSLYLYLAAALATGCAATPTVPEKEPAAIFKKPMERVQAAAVDALVANGFEVKKQEPNYVEGARPHKVGLFVGSGGETVGIWLTKEGSDATGVRIDTAKSFVGIAGQKSWDAEILMEMRKSLAE